jgi:hypothetical protein
MFARHAILDAIAQGLHQRLDFVLHAFQLVRMAKDVKVRTLFLCVCNDLTLDSRDQVSAHLHRWANAVPVARNYRTALQGMA